MGIETTVVDNKSKHADTFASHYLSDTSKSETDMIEPEKNYTVLYGNLNRLPARVRYFVEENAKVCQPDAVHICDGSDKERELLYYMLQRDGTIKPLKKYENCWLAKTDPADVARVESRTFISTQEKNDTVPNTKSGVKGTLANWMSPVDMEAALTQRFPGCMRGRTMYVIPFSMGPIGSPLSKIGIELTDSAYVVASMRVMTRIGTRVLDALKDGEFIKCLHSVGKPITPGISAGSALASWPCNPTQTLVAHLPERNEICSFGSGYGGNSLLGKKCFALRLGSNLARREGWFAEHMLIMGVENPQGKKKYFAAAFPSACGKTNLAMMEPALPGYKVTCVGDDIAWMRFDKNGQLRAINPEAGFFGVAPGTSMKTNPNAMKTVTKDTIFTNVASTNDGGVFWEGMEDELPDNASITSWTGTENWQKDSGKPAAHPNSRFCSPACQCPIIDEKWEDPEGVPIDGIIFGGRRPEGVPLVYESFDWQHGVFIGAALKSEATAAAEHKGKVIMHDPFAMRPFFGYNFGHYLDHWLCFQDKPGVKLPKIFHVNWFRKGPDGFLWPGFGENARVLDWMFRRTDGEACAEKSAVGYIPTPGSIDLSGLKQEVDMNALFKLPKDFWESEVKELKNYFEEQVGEDLPAKVRQELSKLEMRVKSEL